MTNTYRFDSRRQAQQAWPVGKGMWHEGHERENFWIVEKSEVFQDHSNSMWGVEVTTRPATDAEFIPARLRWLEKQRDRAAMMCEWGNPSPSAGVIGYRAEVKAIDAEMAALKSAEVAQ